MSVSVIIPLYNKESEISRTIQSVINQSFTPLEIIIIDDGSTDNSLEIVRSFNHPLIKIITQQNQGVSAARNKGAASAKGDFLAFLDADDTWHTDYLSNINRLIKQYPTAGLYTTSYNITTKNKSYPQKSNIAEGIVKNFFLAIFSQHICLPSTATIPRQVFKKCGGFPEGMRLGEDQYLWFKIACEYPICFTPLRLMNYGVQANNRSNSIYKREQTAVSFKDLYDPKYPERNEYLARCEVGRAIVFAAKLDDDYAKEIEQFYSYTKLNRKSWRRLWLINRLPKPLKNRFLNTYNYLARIILKKFT